MNASFDITTFKKKLSTQWLGHSVCYEQELDSTNAYIKNLPGDALAQGMMCITDNQIKGRGQYQRKWESETGKNLTFSLVFRPHTSEGLHVLTLACALAMVELLNEEFPQTMARIKWPNDVLLKEKKVAGILTETVFNGNQPDRVIIGIGLNVNQEFFPPGLEEKATSLFNLGGQEVSREVLLSRLLQRMEHYYQLWHRGKKELIKSINRNIIGYGQWVGLKVDGTLQEETYKMLGVDESGKLLMLNQEGGIEPFSYEQIRLVTD